MTEQINYEELSASKIYDRQGSPARSVQEYIGPVVDRLSKLTNNLTFQVSKKVTNYDNEGNEDSANTSFGRVLVKAQVPGYDLGNIAGSTIAFIYALDRTVPEFITTSGYSVFACTNLCITSDKEVSRFKDNHVYAQTAVMDYIDDLDKKAERMLAFHNTLQARDLSTDELQQRVGHLLLNSKSVGSSPIVYAAKQLSSPNSPYYARNGESNDWEVYNAVTQYFTNSKNFLDTSSKTLELTKLMSAEIV